MILFSLDFETTGVNTFEDEVIEVGSVLYSTNQHKCLDSQGLLIKTNRTISQEITDITNITPAAVAKFGYDDEAILDTVLDFVEQADAVIGYNCRRFDRKILQSWANRREKLLPGKLWIDLFADLPWKVPTGKLSHVAADHGILNLFPHSALSDAQTVLAIAGKYDSNMLRERAESPVVILQSHTDRAGNELVKRAPFKFRWNPTNKIWWRAAKQQDVEEIIRSAPFRITVEKGRTLEDLED